MAGGTLHYHLDLLFSLSALALFILLSAKRALDWSEEPTKTLLMEENDGE